MVISSPPEMSWGVRADFSVLTPHVPPHSMLSRLHAGPLPGLIPSDDYGMLLPYVGAVSSSYEGLHTTKFGLVTIEGMIVTDAVYERIDIGFNYHTNTRSTAYQLAVNIPGGESAVYQQRLLAVCAVDGSWITAFEYVDIVFSQDVILMMRNYDTFDIDVYNYDGRFLYNFLGLDWIDDIAGDTWAGSIIHSASDGYMSARLRNRALAFIDVATGEIVRRTEFTGADMFSEGLAAVAVTMPGSYETLWGYINRDFEMVIPPRYIYANRFMNGSAVAAVSDTHSLLINTRGETLLSVTDGTIEQFYDDTGFIVHRWDGRSPVYYTKDLIEIELLSKPEDDFFYAYSLGGGWLSGANEDGAWLFTLGEEHFFPGFSYISYTDGEFLIYRDTEQNTGVISLSGAELIPPESNMSITAVTDGQAARAFIVNIFEPQPYSLSYELPRRYAPSRFRLVGTDGRVIAFGRGTMSYDESTGLLSVQAEDSFSYLSHDAEVIISIPLMSYALD